MSEKLKSLAQAKKFFFTFVFVLIIGCNGFSPKSVSRQREIKRNEIRFARFFPQEKIILFG